MTTGGMTSGSTCVVTSGWTGATSYDSTGTTSFGSTSGSIGATTSCSTTHSPTFSIKGWTFSGTGTSS